SLGHWHVAHDRGESLVKAAFGTADGIALCAAGEVVLQLRNLVGRQFAVAGAVVIQQIAGGSTIHRSPSRDRPPVPPAPTAAAGSAGGPCPLPDATLLCRSADPLLRQCRDK